MKKSLTVIAVAVMMTGCTTMQKGAGIGALAGGGLGAIIGHQSGNSGAGALIGAAVGGLGGGAIGNHMADKQFCSKCGYITADKISFCPKDGTALKAKIK